MKNIKNAKYNVVESYLLEIQTSKKMYHASQHQNLKMITIKEAEKNSSRALKGHVWGSTDKSYCSTFCIPRSSKLGFRSGIYKGDKQRTIEVPKQYEHWLKRPCSIYEVDSTPFVREQNRTTEDWISDQDVKVLKEYKYRTARECLEQNNIRVQIIS